MANFSDWERDQAEHLNAYLAGAFEPHGIARRKSQGCCQSNVQK